MRIRGAGFSIQTILLVLPAAGIEALLLWLRTLTDLRVHIVETVAVLLATSLFYIVSVWLLLQAPQHTSRLVIGLTLGTAIIFRLTVFGIDPGFSDDVYRYRWEGKIQAHGHNPYSTAPDDPRLVSLRDAVYPRIVNPELRAVYGPLAELQQWLSYRIAAALSPDPAVQVFWFKLAPALTDLGVLGALWMLLRARGLPTSRVLIYAWCPLPVFEFWVAAHNDAILILFLVLALALFARGRSVGSYGALSLAALAKIWPVLLFAAFTGWERPRILRGLVTLATVSAIVSFPYWTNLEYNIRLTSGFLGGWRNNDSLHGIVAALTPNPFIAKYVTAGLIVLVVLLISRFRWTLEARTLATVVSILLLSANVHPWYLTWIIPLLAFYPIPALLLWTALMPLNYAVLIDWTRLGEWNGVTAWRWFVYLPAAAMQIISWRLNRSTRR